jgi:hypothetical protein
VDRFRRKTAQASLYCAGTNTPGGGDYAIQRWPVGVIIIFSAEIEQVRPSPDPNISPFVVEANDMVLEEISAEHSVEVSGKLGWYYYEF